MHNHTETWGFFHGKMNYKNYLESKHWKKTRAKFIERPHHQYCYVCLSIIDLHVHHKKYRTRDGKPILFNETGGQLVRLCSECHNNLHKTYVDGSSLKSLRRIASLIESGIERDMAFITYASHKIYKETTNRLRSEGTYKKIEAKHRTIQYVLNNA